MENESNRHSYGILWWASQEIVGDEEVKEKLKNKNLHPKKKGKGGRKEGKVEGNPQPTEKGNDQRKAIWKETPRATNVMLVPNDSSPTESIVWANAETVDIMGPSINISRVASATKPC